MTVADHFINHKHVELIAFHTYARLRSWKAMNHLEIVCAQMLTKHVATDKYDSKATFGGDAMLAIAFAASDLSFSRCHFSPHT